MVNQASSMVAFGVIVCPKCREHSQIIELAGARKTRCQKCASNLEVRKLRLFFTSDDLEEAISARTILQARLHGQESELEGIFSERSGSPTVASGGESGDFAIHAKDFVDRRKPPSRKKDRNLLILDLLGSNGGKMAADSLKALALEHGIGEEKFGQILEKLIDSGEIYEPATGIVSLV